jgi:hypothetical protein
MSVGWCHSLDLKCSLRAHVLEAWSLGWRYWEVVEPLGLGPSRRCSGPGDVSLKGTIGPQPLPLPLFFTF